jgi:flagellar hook-associated protein 1
MSLFDSLEIGRKSLAAQQTAIQVAGNNIANVNTPGYHRQRVSLQTTPPLETPAGQIGSGVEVKEIRSVRDLFLEMRLAQSAQNAGRQQAIVGYSGQVESAFGTAQSGIQENISRFFNSFSALAADAGSPSLRYGVLSAAENLAAGFRRAAQQLTDIRNNANAASVDTVREINTLTSTIAELNGQIATAESDGTEAATLRDQRADALNQLATMLDIHYYEAGDGSISVSTSGGATLVSGHFADAMTLQTAPPNGHARINLALRDITGSITGGKLGGLLEVRDRLVPAYQTDLDTLAEAVITRVNAVHRAGTDLQSPPTAPGLNLFNPAASVAGAAITFSVNPTVAGDQRYLAVGRSGSPGDNANALAIADLASQKLVTAGTQTFSEAFGSLQFKVGTDQQSAQKQLDTQNALLTQLENARDSVSGVSLDEEAVDLIRFERAYQASARFINIIDQLTGDLIETLGG